MLDQHNRKPCVMFCCLCYAYYVLLEVANKQILQHTFLLHYMPHYQQQEKYTRHIWEKGEEMLSG